MNHHLHDGAPSHRSHRDEIRANELAFRRGFSHAAEMIADALQGGATVADIEAFIQHVDAWRFDQPDDQIIAPPSVFIREGSK